MTFNEFWPDYIERKKLAVKMTTVAAYATLWETHLAGYWGEIDLDGVRNSTAQRYIDEQLLAGRTPKCVKDEITLVKNIMKQYCISEDKPFVTPIVIWPTAAKSGVKKRDKFTDKDLTAILGDCKESDAHWKKLIAISAMTGARIGEVCGLRFSDFDFSAHTVHIQRTVGRLYLGKDKGSELFVNDPKTINSNRVVPVPTWICQYFKKYKDLFNRADDDYIAPGDMGVPFIEPRTLRSKYKRMCEKLGLPYKPPHSLRHTYASRLLLKGVDARTAAELLGHSDVEMTLNVYSHSDDAAKLAAAKKVFL